jgi:hypothetical protein
MEPSPMIATVRPSDAIFHSNSMRDQRLQQTNIHGYGSAVIDLDHAHCKSASQ